MSKENESTRPGWANAIEIGQSVDSPGRTVTESMLSLLTTLTGYTHPLFTDVTWSASTSSIGVTPLPGAVVLALLGGLAEQSGFFGKANLVLVGFESVRFNRVVVAGDTLRVRITVVEKELKSNERTLIRMEWTGLNQKDETVAGLYAVFMVSNN